VTGRQAVRLVARREVVETAREKSFLISTAVSIAIVALVATLPPLLGWGEPDEYTVGVADSASQPVADAARRNAEAFDAKLNVVSLDPAQARAALDGGDVDAVLAGRRLESKDDPDDKLVNLLQAANERVGAAQALERAGLRGEELRAALDPPPLSVETIEPVNEARERRGGFAFVAVIILYGQIVTYGYLVSMGVVQEKASRVIEVLLAAIRPIHLLSGKVLGLGVLGFAQLLLTAIVGLGVATASGALDVDGDVLVASGLALAWYLVGYAFYACAFAAAGALVPRQEELQSTTTPLTMAMLASLFIAFAVMDNPDGTLATVTSFIPTTAPMTMPPRIALGEAPAGEIVAAFLVTAGAAAALIPFAARVYTGAVLRTGAAVKLRDAWKAARA
jgi:ABC-2 type transport system permease protein